MADVAAKKAKVKERRARKSEELYKFQSVEEIDCSKKWTLLELITKIFIAF